METKLTSNVENFRYKFEDSFEESILARLLRSKEFYDKYGIFVKVEYLESQMSRITLFHPPWDHLISPLLTKRGCWV